MLLRRSGTGGGGELGERGAEVPLAWEAACSVGTETAWRARLPQWSCKRTKTPDSSSHQQPYRTPCVCLSVCLRSPLTCLTSFCTTGPGPRAAVSALHEPAEDCGCEHVWSVGPCVYSDSPVRETRRQRCSSAPLTKSPV